MNFGVLSVKMAEGGMDGRGNGVAGGGQAPRLAARAGIGRQNGG